MLNKIFLSIFLLLLSLNQQALAVNNKQEAIHSLAVNNKQEAIHFAAGNNELEILTLILKLDKNLINVQDLWGNTPIRYAMKSNALDTLNHLLTTNADYTITDKDKNSLLHCGAANNSIDATILLLEFIKKENCKKNNVFFSIPFWINQGNKKGCNRTAMHLAAQEGFIDYVDLLISYGGDVNALDEWGNGPLRYAIKGKNSEMAKFLIEKGAKVTQLDKQNNSLLHLAAQEGEGEIVNLILDTKPSEDFIKLKNSNDLTAAQLLLKWN